MVKVIYTQDGQEKSLSFQNLDVFSSWLPSTRIVPISMEVDGKLYTQLNVSRGEKFGVDYLKIVPVK